MVKQQIRKGVFSQELYILCLVHKRAQLRRVGLAARGICMPSFLHPRHRAALCRPGGATGSSAGHPFPFAFAGVCVLCLEKGIVVDPFGFVVDFLDAIEGRAVCGGIILR